jgi:hypothetical protein
MIVRHFVLFHPLRDLVFPVIFDVAAERSVSKMVLSRRSATLLASLLKILVTIIGLGKFLQNKKTRETNSSCEAALEKGLHVSIISILWRDILNEAAHRINS